MAFKINARFSIHEEVFIVDEKNVSIKRCKVISFEAKVEADGTSTKEVMKYMLKSDDGSYYHREETGMFDSKDKLLEALDSTEVF